ncbi:MAG TPA: hypothetical protein VG692_08960 [Gemmatimonadales bacterium]|nr:hypothetical protein [Gemmatimonadales bacterium]
MRLRRAAVALLFSLTALGLGSSLSLGWGAADLPDGTRYKVSPLGLSHVLQLHQTVSTTEDCRWGDSQPLCAFRTETPVAVLALRSVPILVALAAALALLGALAWLLPDHSPVAKVRAGMILLPPALAASALGLFAWAAPRASEALNPLSFGVGGTKATLQIAVVIALLLGFRTCALGRTTAAGARPRQALLVGLGLAPFALMFPLLGGLAFAGAALALGAGLAWLVSSPPGPTITVG